MGAASSEHSVIKSSNPFIIQGGMGVAVSGWRLAQEVSRLGQLGVVSGTALAVTLARRLQLGDLDGKLRHAMGRFPIPAVAERVLKAYFRPDGLAPGAAYRLTAMPTLRPGAAFQELTVLANFVEIFLAKEGHHGCVGLNLLEKIQLPTLPSLFGAMLAGVDYILMGAGIPRSIPGILDRFAEGRPGELKIDVQGALPGEEFHSTFDPQAFFGGAPIPPLHRPLFLGIISSATLAMTLARKSNGKVDGFVVEGDTAGGHNAPPRGPMQLSSEGEPVYGPRDVPELEKIRALGLPFWLAGSYGRVGGLARARELGAAGIQVGTAFAFCEESGLDEDLKQRVLRLSEVGAARIFTDPVASPTGFPFKVVQVDDTLSDRRAYERRERVCDLGYLRHLYRRADGSVGYRCPSEPVANYLKKGGAIADTVGRKCVCNGLPSSVGLGQIRPGGADELPLLTAGNEVARVAEFLAPGRTTYTAAEVIERLLSSPSPDATPEAVAAGAEPQAATR